jgi:cell division transport system permease protein
MLTSIYRVIKFALQDFWRNIWLSFITILILVLALFSANLLIFFNALADTAVELVEEKIDVSIFFKPEALESKINEVKSSLVALPQVREVGYISKDEALQKFKERHKDEPKILEAIKEIGDNPLGPSLVIKAYKTEDYPVILEKLNDPNVLPEDLVQDKNFNDHELLIGKISNIKQKVGSGGLILSGLFSLIAILIVFNTIRVAIYTHREEIGTMRLVGATNWFIRVPFILESVLYAFLACLLTIVILYPLLGVLQPYLVNFFEGAGFDALNYFNDNFFKIFGWELLITIILSMISSSLAVGKYLKV